MTKWLYRRLMVWSHRGEQYEKDGAGWYVACWWRERVSFRDLLFTVASPTAKRDVRRLSLNPERNWEKVSSYEWLAWDEEAGHADLAMEVVSRIGLEGWDLAGIQLGSGDSGWPSSYYIFKKPAE